MQHTYSLHNAGLIAVLRGITPNEVVPVCDAILEGGWHAIEITLNSPDAFSSLETLAKHFKKRCLVGAGTVLTVPEVKKISDLGLDFVISPNLNRDVIAATKQAKMLSIPGVLTPSEAFSSLEAGADALKIFPGEAINPNYIKAIRSVLPSSTLLYVTGGITEHNIESFLKQRVSGFGIGGGLYKPNMMPQEVLKNALKYTSLFQNAMNLE